MLNPKQHVGSQPADLIAVKDNETMLVDCKTCNSKYFQLARIEENQWQAYKKFRECGNTSYMLAIKYNNNIYMIPLSIIDKDKKSIDLERECCSKI